VKCKSARVENASVAQVLHPCFPEVERPECKSARLILEKDIVILNGVEWIYREEI
jgi:hypothetical protein